MATYAVGDLHGCLAAFRRLLAAVRFNPDAGDRLMQVGDLVNRGPQSAAVVRWMMKNERAASVVLGNHDIHLLAIRDGFAQARKCDDGIARLLNEPDADAMCEWLRNRPFAIRDGETLTVHAGLPPQWSADDAESVAAECAAVVSGDEWKALGPKLYGDAPDKWRDDLRGAERFRVAVNALTRLRACRPDGAMIFPFAGKPGDIPDGGVPWFEAPGRNSAGVRVVFGHWSALGFVCRPNLLALDTGCFWGGKLTAVRLDDGKIFAVRGGDDTIAD